MPNPVVHAQRGYTLVELLMAMTIGMLVVGMATANLGMLIKTSRADGGLASAAAGMRNARELAVGNRRNMKLTFGTNTLIITRVEYCTAPCTPTTTTLRTITLEGRAEFRLTTGLPDTPDAFGNATATAFGALTPPMFTTDGSFINSNGDVLNGSLFIGIPNDPLSARAITVFGPTGAMRLWRWNGRAWVET